MIQRSRQKGAALLLMMLVILVALTAVLVGRLNAINPDAARTAETSAALAEAKSALLAWASTLPDRVPGRPVRLPCPDLDGGGGFADGEAHATACGARGENMLGRLPWKTLGLEALADGSGACLWYAVSGDYKDADAASAELLNPDSAGSFEMYDASSGALLAGATAEDRPVAILLAPGSTVAGQARAAAVDQGCSPSFNAADFLDDAGAIGVDNASVAGIADVIDRFASDAIADGSHNDRLLVIRQSEVAALVTERHDYDARIDTLGLAVAECVANYARQNIGGANDLRLPWPAPLTLADYRLGLNYSDDSTNLSGRLPDVVDDSALTIGNPLPTVLTSCDPAVVPTWTTAVQGDWRNLKDHFFYLVAADFAPSASVPTGCGDCISVNGAGSYAAVVMFAGAALDLQSRTMPPLDADTRGDVLNYLEGANPLVFPTVAGAPDLESRPVAPDFNDRLFCIASDLSVSGC